MSAAYEQLAAAVGNHVSSYRDDLEKIDRFFIDRHENIPFLHVARESGTHLFHMLPSELLPPSDVDTKYLFSTIPTTVQLNRNLDGLRHLYSATLNPEGTSMLTHHFDGQRIHQISGDKAVELFQGYINQVVPTLETAFSKEFRRGELEENAGRSRGLSTERTEPTEVANGENDLGGKESLRIRAAEGQRGENRVCYSQ
jgi:hypothetical protein